MSARRFGTQSLVRLLGNWQETSSRTPLWRQLAEALRLLILDGRLTLQTRLPGERELAAALNVSRTTIASALGQLREEGFLYSRQGSGSRIVLPERPADLPLPAGISSTLNLSTAALSAFALILRLFTGPGDRVVIDAPTYPMAISAIQGASCRPVGVALPQQGWDCDGLAATIAQTAPRLAWLMPDFHNPTGRCMDALTRQRVADIAARTRTTLVIDETMADLWYNAPPPPPLASFNPDAAVLTIGSAGKSFWGGLRIGWIRASARTIASLIQARDSLDLGTPLLEQLACCWLLENAATLLPPRRDMLKARRDMCETLMAEYFPRWRFSPPEGGLSFWVELPDMLATLFSARAESQGIHIGTGTRFGLEGAFDRYLRLPFTLPDEALRRAFSTLQPLWQSLAEQKENTRLRKII
ncbi:TPA: PLP-dependent aminotransferase family protein [Klebsiella pneumoniae]|nr:PLP-dependent aminotransferase family protein [Klebsiella pneumoniae]HBS5143418.1 PLP-dependent aminotransferase family protein [Klebsiella pneumoniae]